MKNSYEITNENGKLEYINADFAEATENAIVFYVNGTGTKKPQLVGLYPLDSIRSVRISLMGD